MKLALVYRGPLASCPYRCRYCAVRARRPTAEEGVEDARALERFVRMVEARPAADALSILFAPRGEALVHARYRDALAGLAALSQVRLVAAQTSLAFDPGLLGRAAPGKLALWTTFHPTETTVERFAARCRCLAAMGVRHSVGAVALPAHLDAIEALRRALDPGVYLWLNRSHGGRPLGSAELARVRAVDPWFIEAPPRSRGRPCGAGSSVLFVDGAGDARRCLALAETLGNVHAAPLEEIASRTPEPCPAPFCRCHLGYVHLEPPALVARFGEGVLARIPARWPPAAPAS
jgi:MoaA/NifB/PqqE/SkfB family radical SAM enzyme